MAKIKVGDLVRVLDIDHIDNCSNHKVGDEFVVGHVYNDKWLRTKKERCDGIPESCVELVQKSVNNTYEIY